LCTVNKMVILHKFLREAPMKIIITLTLLFLMGITTTVNAKILMRDTPVYDQYGHYRETLPSGTHILFKDYTIKVRGVGIGYVIQEVLNPRDLRFSKRRFARSINRQHGYGNYIIFRRDLSYSRISPPRRRYTTYRETIIERNPPSLDRSYEVCYERPKNQVIRINEEQRRSGNANMRAGFATAIAGLALGALTENRQLGNIVTAVGVGFVAAGAIQVASSEEIFSNGSEINCKTYYTPDRRVYRFRTEGRSCFTTRYYSNRWGPEYEYFETRCDSQTYITFERSYDIYGY